MGWIQVEFSFETAQAKCEGIANLVPDPAAGETANGEGGEGEWKAWVVFTQMDQVKGHEMDVGRLEVPDEEGVEAEKWDVLVVGAGQSGCACFLLYLSVGDIGDLGVEGRLFRPRTEGHRAFDT